MTEILTRSSVTFDNRLLGSHHDSNTMAYRSTMHLNMDNNNKPPKVSNAMHYRGQSREGPASPPPDYGGFPENDSPPDSPKLPKFDYNNDRIQNDLLQEICSDIGIKDAMDLDFYDFDTNMFTDKRESYGSDGDVLDQVIPFGQIQQQQERASLTKQAPSSAVDPYESVSQACSTAPSAQVSPNIPSQDEDSKGSSEDGNLIKFRDDASSKSGNSETNRTVTTASETAGNVGGPGSVEYDRKTPKPNSPYPQPPSVGSRSVASPAMSYSGTGGPPSVGPPSVGPPSVGPPSCGGPPSVGSPSVGPPSVGPPSVGPPSVGPPSNRSGVMGPPSNQSVRSYPNGPPSNQSVTEVPPSPSKGIVAEAGPGPSASSSMTSTRHTASAAGVHHPGVPLDHQVYGPNGTKQFVLTGVPGVQRRGRNLESPFDQGYYSVGSGSMYTGSHYGSNSDLTSTGDTPPMSATDKVEEYLTTSVNATSGTVTDSHGGMIPQSHSTPLPKGQGIIPNHQSAQYIAHMQQNRGGKNVTFAVPNSESRPHDFNAYGKRPSEAQLTPRSDSWDPNRTPEAQQNIYQSKIKTGSQPSSPKKLRVSYTPDMLSPTRNLAPPGGGEEEEEPPFDPSLFPSHQGLMKHLITDRSSAFRSHPFFPLLRDLIIADMNFYTPTFPFALIANLPPDFDRLVQNYIHRNPSLASMPRTNQAVESVFMDALRYAHKSLIEKINERRKTEGDTAPKSSSAIEEFCDRFDRAVKNTASSQGGFSGIKQEMNGGIVSQQVPNSQGSMMTPQGHMATSLQGQFKPGMNSGGDHRSHHTRRHYSGMGHHGTHRYPQGGVNPPAQSPGVFQPNPSLPTDFNFQNQAIKQQQHPQQTPQQSQQQQQHHQQMQRHPGYETPPPAMQSYQSNYPPSTPTLQRQGSHPGMYQQRVTRTPQYGQMQGQPHMQGQMTPGQTPQGQMPIQGQMRQTPGQMNGPGQMNMPGHGQNPGQILPGNGQMSPGPMHLQRQMSNPGQMPHAGQMHTPQGQLQHQGQMQNKGQMPGYHSGHQQNMGGPYQQQNMQQQSMQHHNVHYQQQQQRQQHANQHSQHRAPHTPQPELYSPSVEQTNLAQQGMLSKSMTCLPGQYGANRMNHNGPGQGGVYRPQSSPDLPRHVSMSMPRPPSAGGYPDMNNSFSDPRPLGPQQRSLSQGQTLTQQHPQMGGGQYNPSHQQPSFYPTPHKTGSMTQLPTGHGGQQMSAPSFGSYGDLHSGSEEDSRPDTPSERSGVSSASSKKQVLPKEAVGIMLEWLKNHQHNPYPNEMEKELLMAQTGLSISQINYWFTNARRRILPKWMLQRYLEDQAIATGEDPSKIKVTGSAQEVRQIAKDVLQGRALPYLGRPSQSPSPPISVGSPVWPPSEEVRNFAAPLPSNSIPGNYFNGGVVNNRVFQNYNVNQSQFQQNVKNTPEGDLICLSGDTFSNSNESKLCNSSLLAENDVTNGNSNTSQLQSQKRNTLHLKIKEERCDGSNNFPSGSSDNENGEHLKTTVTDLSFLLS